MNSLTVDQQKKLLALARVTIHNALRAQKPAEPGDSGEFTDGIFREKRGAFVTLHHRGKLRGCIGYIVGTREIPETITDMAIAAAFRDPRFPPLTSREFGDIDIEISVLTPITEVKDVAEIEVGRDGLIVSSGRNQGLLLPQVATEYQWNRDQFLEHTCYKAGLPGDAWKKKETRIEKFSAQVFGEKELGMLDRNP
jgi:AmmeMemoRadiSam system protein A